MNFEERFFPPQLFSEEERAGYIKQARTIQVKKGEYILHKGDVQDCFYFVISGCMRQFIVDGSGKEHILMFCPEDWMVADYESLMRGTPAHAFVDAVEPSTLYVVPKNLIIDLWKRDVDMLTLGNERLRNMVFDLQRRIIELMSSTAEERYVNFSSTYPYLTNRIPLKMIASYLGITPESLSRVRKNLVRGSKTV